MVDSIKEKLGLRSTSGQTSHVFFSKNNHELMRGSGTREVASEFGKKVEANFFGSFTIDEKGEVIPGAESGPPPNPETYAYLGYMENGVLIETDKPNFSVG